MAYKRPERKHYYDRKAKATIYEIVNPRFHRKSLTLEGVRGTSLPYTSGEFLRPGEKGPRGGRGYLKCWHTLWWAGGRFCEVQSIKDEDGKYHREFVPVTKKVWNRWDASEGTFQLVDGVLVNDIAEKDENGNLY